MTSASRALQKRIDKIKDDIHAWEEENTELEIICIWGDERVHAKKGEKIIKTSWGRGSEVDKRWLEIEHNNSDA